jgi:acyl-CoA hydrolase
LFLENIADFSIGAGLQTPCFVTNFFQKMNHLKRVIPRFLTTSLEGYKQDKFKKIMQQLGNRDKTRKKRMRDSYIEHFIRITDPVILNDYMDVFKARIRMGKILEDMDLVAAMTSASHAVTEENTTVVTAYLDRIDLLEEIPSNMDIKISGMVTFVGSSSMEVSLKLETMPNGAPLEEKRGYEASLVESNGKKLMTANFIMVSND